MAMHTWFCLLYTSKRGVERCTKKVEELSGGRIAYVHIKGMDLSLIHI